MYNNIQYNNLHIRNVKNVFKKDDLLRQRGRAHLHTAFHSTLLFD